VRLGLARLVSEYLERLPWRCILADCITHFALKASTTSSYLDVGLEQLVFVLNPGAGSDEKWYVLEFEQMFGLDAVGIEERRLKLRPIFERKGDVAVSGGGKHIQDVCNARSLG